MGMLVRQSLTWTLAGHPEIKRRSQPLSATVSTGSKSSLSRCTSLKAHSNACPSQCRPEDARPFPFLLHLPQCAVQLSRFCQDLSIPESSPLQVCYAGTGGCPLGVPLSSEALDALLSVTRCSSQQQAHLPQLLLHAGALLCRGRCWQCCRMQVSWSTTQGPAPDAGPQASRAARAGSASHAAVWDCLTWWPTEASAHPPARPAPMAGCRLSCGRRRTSPSCACMLPGEQAHLPQLCLHAPMGASALPTAVSACMPVRCTPGRSRPGSCPQMTSWQSLWVGGCRCTPYTASACPLPRCLHA